MTALAIGGAPPAQASSATGLPPIGSEIPMSMLALNVPITIHHRLMTVDFRGGIKTRTEVNPHDPINGVRLRVVGFRVTAELPERDGGTITIDQPDDARSEPLVLTTKDPALLIGKLTQFPPRGDLYQLQNPVDLVLPDDPDTTIATIQRFPVKVGGL